MISVSEGFRSRSGVSRLWFRSQPVSFGSVDSIPILAAARIPVQMEFLAGTRKGSVGCSLCSVHEASDFPHFPTSFARTGRSRLLARIDGLRDQGDWKANGTGLSGDFQRGAAN